MAMKMRFVLRAVALTAALFTTSIGLEWHWVLKDALIILAVFVWGFTSHLDALDMDDLYSNKHIYLYDDCILVGICNHWYRIKRFGKD